MAATYRIAGVLKSIVVGPHTERMPTSIFEALEFIDWLRAAFGGWRFVFSASFRRETRARWRHESSLRIVWDMSCGVAGIAFTLLLVHVVISLFAGWGWIQRFAG